MPGRTTSKYQPMDAGIIAMIKGILRKLFGIWARDLTILQLNSGTAPSDIKLPSDVPTCKMNLCKWLAQARLE